MSDGDNNMPGSGRSLGGGPVEAPPSSWSQRASATGGSRETSSLRSGPGRIATLGNMAQSSGGRRARSRGDDSDDDDDGEKGESWFAGGERSGISIQNPDSQRSVPGGGLVRDLLQRAAQAGPPPPTASARASTAFRGGGHMLGSDEVESQYVADPDAVDEEGSAIRHLTFWRNGFQVEDGELMLYDDPQHAKILAEINSGLAPPSILNVRTGQHVEVRVSKRIQEDYVPPKGAKAFGGSGHRLGGASPPLPGADAGETSMPGSFPSTSSTAPNPISSSEEDRASFSTKFEVDQTLPTTSIQIRLADGTRMVARMNLTHTIGDIRNFINASRAENLARPYTIGTTFPNRTLDDANATIQGAGLVNSVIVQRWV